MNKLIWTPHFIKSAKKYIKNYPENTSLFKERIKMLEENVFDRSLRTHKLKGQLKGFYSASINYSHRIVFQLEEDDKVILTNIGSHEETY